MIVLVFLHFFANVTQAPLEIFSSLVKDGAGFLHMSKRKPEIYFDKVSLSASFRAAQNGSFIKFQEYVFSAVPEECHFVCDEGSGRIDGNIA